jgi:putative acetyltransferase
VLIRRETAADVPDVRAVVEAAFVRPEEPAVVPDEVRLLDALRDDPGWEPALSLVATAPEGGAVLGHVVCTWGSVDRTPTLGLGPLAVRPDHQRRGVGAALVHAVLGAADACGAPLVALLGSPAYYGRFGFVPATHLGVAAPDPAWGEYFQARPLHAYDPALRGTFAYAAPFAAL